MTRKLTALAVAAATWHAGVSSSLAAQVGDAVAELSADSVAMGDVFELRVRLPVPAGSVVYFPDTVLTATFIESFSPVRFEAEAAPEGAWLTLAYPLIAFEVGNIPVPGLDVFTGPSDGSAGEPLPGGSVIGDWSEVPRGPSIAPFVTRIPRREIWVQPVFTPDQLAQGVTPMPPDDVVGLNWSWPALALVLLFSSVLGGAVVTTTRDLLTGRTARDPVTSAMTLEEARRVALRHLDRLREELPDVAPRDFYTRSSDVVRGYVVRFDASWGPQLTSRELLRSLGASPHRATPDLAREMETAEVVKFGRLRPGPAEAAEHVDVLSGWVRASAGEPS